MDIPTGYYKVGKAGRLSLYEQVIYCGTTKGTRSWIVDFGPHCSHRQFVNFADRPTPKRLRAKQFDVGHTTPNRWKIIAV